MPDQRQPRGATRALYTPEQRARRDATRWTLVQGILAPIQFLVFAVSVVLVVRSLATGEGVLAAHVSIIIKTILLYTIMVTGAIWEKVVFGQYASLPCRSSGKMSSASFVIALHTAYPRSGCSPVGWDAALPDAARARRLRRLHRQCHPVHAQAARGAAAGSA
ncbi:MAG: 2-vinyl bacteriochlorophyllide hydratase [Gemmatimonadaceae bacterium]|nr:2-vinyl bacteriochlorophyllide hydratase [Gemmatimonadaceae bacterium]